MTIGWKFPGSGVYQGFNDSGIETFTGSRFPSLAREVLQNSLDASKEGKVTVEFEVIDIPTTKFPGRNELTKVMRDCAKEDAADRKARDFLANAEAILDKPDIQCLRITDFGTTGLQGDPDASKGQWFAITKASGVSAKQDSKAGGSYGIGKNAPFVVSNLHTIFYSTRYQDGASIVERAQGKSVLMSRTLRPGNYIGNTGFYGVKDKCGPLEGDEIPSFLRLKEEGTRISIAGFKGSGDWQNQIIAAVVSNFFYAIDQKKLEVLIQGESGDPRIIDAETLPSLFDDEAISEFDGVKEAKCYYQISHNKDNERDSELRGLGFSHLWTRVEEGLPRRVALLRHTGMLITDEQQGMKRWPGFSDFAAVYVCESEKGNELLRRMENPQHDSFEPERIGEPSIGDLLQGFPDQQDGRKALKELSKWVRETIKEFAVPDTTEATDLDELNEYLPDQDPDEGLPGDGEERDLEGRPIYQPKPIKIKPHQMTSINGEGDEGGVGQETGKGHGGGGSGGSGADGKRRKSKPVKIEKVRVLQTQGDNRKKTVMFTPAESGPAKISLQIAGDSFYEPLPISKVHSGGTLATTGASTVAVEMVKAERMSLVVTLQEPIEEAILIDASKEEESDEVRSE